MGSFEAYEQILQRHKEDTLENSLQSNLEFESQNKENGGKKNYGETSEEGKFLEIYLRIRQIKTLHAIYAKD